MAVLTNPHLSAVHSANFSKEIGQAHSEADLKAVAAKHGPYLLSDDAKRLRDEYAARLASLRRLKP
ncbi:MAG: hypothetical protein LBV49_06010 [Azonexus sp.]|jgi:hypothetical protein|nr:hypothetical protein [Azonexus sp.]